VRTFDGFERAGRKFLETGDARTRDEGKEANDDDRALETDF